MCYTREKAGTSVVGNNSGTPGDISENENEPRKEKVDFSVLGADIGAAADEEEDYGGLMVCFRDQHVRLVD